MGEKIKRNITKEYKNQCLEEILRHLQVKNSYDENKIKYELSMIKLEEYADCSEEIEGIDIRTFLTKLSSYENEGWLVIAIDNNKISDWLCLEGSNTDYIEFSDNQKKDINSFIEKNANSKLYQYHNHPDRLAAMPSIEDIKNPKYRLKKAVLGDAKSECENDISKLLPAELEFEDIGIVTKLDFCSFQQIGAEKIKELLEKLKIKETNLCNKGFNQFGITDNMYDE